MSLTTDEVVYIGMKGHVLALERQTGQEIWRRKLKGWSFVNVVLDGPSLFAATRGELFSLDPASGEILWHNPLKGMGYNLITFARGNAQAALLEQYQEEERQATAANNSHIAGT